MVQNYRGGDSNVSTMHPQHDKVWNAQERKRYGLKIYNRIQIPVLYKGDLKAMAGILKGLANQMEFIAQEPQKSDLGAYLELKGLCREVNEKLASIKEKRPGM